LESGNENMDNDINMGCISLKLKGCSQRQWVELDVKLPLSGPNQ